MVSINMGKLLIVLIIIFSIPLTYIYYFLIGELPKKIGYPKFILVILGYIILVAIAVELLMEGYLNLLSFYLFFVLTDLVGVWFLRKEFIADMKGLFRKNNAKEERN